MSACAELVHSMFCEKVVHLQPLCARQTPFQPTTHTAKQSNDQYTAAGSRMAWRREASRGEASLGTCSSLMSDTLVGLMLPPQTTTAATAIVTPAASATPNVQKFSRGDRLRAAPPVPSTSSTIALESKGRAFEPFFHCLHQRSSPMPTRGVGRRGLAGVLIAVACGLLFAGWLVPRRRGALLETTQSQGEANLAAEVFIPPAASRAQDSCAPHRACSAQSGTPWCVCLISFACEGAGASLGGHR